MSGNNSEQKTDSASTDSSFDNNSLSVVSIVPDGKPVVPNDDEVEVLSVGKPHESKAVSDRKSPVSSASNTGKQSEPPISLILGLKKVNLSSGGYN
jgi:hypothetical protein